MCTDIMRRIQFHIEEELNETLQIEAAKAGRSKAVLIRECVAAKYGALRRHDLDPLTALVGSVDAEPADVDDVVCGR